MKNMITAMVNEKSLHDLEKRFAEARKLNPNPSPAFVELEQQLTKLKEDISTGDWARFGVIAGVLWYKLDALLAELKYINANTRR